MAEAEERLQLVLAMDPEDEDASANLKIVHSRMGHTPLAARPSETAPTGQKGEVDELELEDLQWKR